MSPTGSLGNNVQTVVPSFDDYSSTPSNCRVGQSLIRHLPFEAEGSKSLSML
jgi:hypothetical protein